MSTDITKTIQIELKKNQDTKYLDFSSKLIPGIEKSRFIGVRVPIIRKLAKKYATHKNINEFLDKLPHKYIEENNLHGLIISTWKDYNTTLIYLDRLLPYVDNWATCDIISPICFKKNKDLLLNDINKWITSDKTYTIRFGIEMAMTHYLDKDYNEQLMNCISKIKSKKYYVNMMIAWYFATALAKQWEKSIKYIINSKLDTWVHNKTIQKAVESYRITNEQKSYLKKFKIK